MNSSRAVTYALLLVAIVIWGWTFVASKVCLEMMSPLQLVASRFLIAAPALKEPIPPAMRLGLAVATLGIVLLVSRGELAGLDWLTSLGDWLALVSTLT